MQWDPWIVVKIKPNSEIIFIFHWYPDRGLAFVWIVLKTLAFMFHVFFSFFILFSFFEKSVSHVLWVPCKKRNQNYTFPVGSVHCSRDPQLICSKKKKNFKTRSHNTIQTFKNYFPTVFSVFNFQQNERYPNKSLKCVWEWILD